MDEIETVEEPTPAQIEFLHDRIDEFNADATGYRDGRWLHLEVRDGDDLVGGVHGWTWGGSAWIDVLWVRADRRATGLGSRLLARAEAEAVARGCAQVALNTHTFQARPFYERHGYEVVGLLTDHPVGHGDYTMRKRLA